MITKANSQLIFFAEKNGFQKCFPWKEFGDGSPRWLYGGGYWEENDVAGFVRMKAGWDKTFRSNLEMFHVEQSTAWKQKERKKS